MKIYVTLIYTRGHNRIIKKTNKLLMKQTNIILFYSNQRLSTHGQTHTGTVHSTNTPVCHEMIVPLQSSAECFPGNSNLPFSCDSGDLETEVHRVQIGWLPLEDIVTPPRLVWLQGGRKAERFGGLTEINTC